MGLEWQGKEARRVTAKEIREVFLRTDLSWIPERLRQRIERGQSLSGVLSLVGPSDAQRSAIDSLMGRRGTRGQSLSVQVESLKSLTGVDDVSDIVRACYGAVTNQKAIRDQRDRAWEKVITESLDCLRGDEIGLNWVGSLRDGSLKRTSKNDLNAARRLMECALSCWQSLPYSGITLAELGVELTGDAHALDRGAPLSSIMARALKHRCGIDANESAVCRREAWEVVGVVVDRLSAPALTFNLEAAPSSLLDGVLRGYRELQHPAYLTFQNLEGENPFIPLPDSMRCVYVVENPSLVEVASTQLGSTCAPLICTEGQPSSAVKRLMRLLSEAGSKLMVRADFDWSGLRIVEQLLSIPNTEPWRMDVVTFTSVDGAIPLSGSELSTLWCDDLKRAMLESGRAVFEEQLVSILLPDLGCSRSSSRLAQSQSQ